MKVLRVEDSFEHLRLDKRDKEILALLCKNARYPLSRIASILKLSREAVDYRIRRLENAHIIAGSRTVINLRKLNYYSYHVFISLHHPKSASLFIKNALAHKSVNALIQYSGKWDFELSIMTTGPEECYLVLQDIVKGIPLQNHEILILLQTIKSVVLPKEFIMTLPEYTIKKNDFSFDKDFQQRTSSEVVLDTLDMRLIHLLSNNAQTRIATLADMLHLSSDTISYRIKKLINAHYIIEFRPVIDYASLNLSIQTILIKTNELSVEQEQQFVNFLKANDVVLWATRTFGTWNYLVYVITKSVQEFHAFVDVMGQQFPDAIKNYEVLFAYQEHKYTFLADGVVLK